eukprot:834428-Prorocentrum_minimum.AAC.2
MMHTRYKDGCERTPSALSGVPAEVPSVLLPTAATEATARAALADPGELARGSASGSARGSCRGSAPARGVRAHRTCAR